jgi:hypothetical protein
MNSLDQLLAQYNELGRLQAALCSDIMSRMSEVVVQPPQDKCASGSPQQKPLSVCKNRAKELADKLQILFLSHGIEIICEGRPRLKLVSFGRFSELLASFNALQASTELSEFVESMFIHFSVQINLAPNDLNPALKEFILDGGRLAASVGLAERAKSLSTYKVFLEHGILNYGLSYLRLAESQLNGRFFLHLYDGNIEASSVMQTIEWHCLGYSEMQRRAQSDQVLASMAAKCREVILDFAGECLKIAERHQSCKSPVPSEKQVAFAYEWRAVVIAARKVISDFT